MFVFRKTTVLQTHLGIQIKQDETKTKWQKDCKFFEIWNFFFVIVSCDST